MALALHRTTKEIIPSIDFTEVPGGEANWIRNPDLSAVQGVPQQDWHIDGDTVRPMTQGEKDARDAEAAAAATANTKALARAWMTSSDPAAVAMRTVIAELGASLKEVRTAQGKPNRNDEQFLADVLAKLQ